MPQLYFLSIVFNGLVGLLFIFGDFRKTNSEEQKTPFSFDSDGFRLVLGILTAVTGVLKLFSPVKNIPILGDLLPAVAGIIAGFVLIFGFYRNHSSNVETEGTVSHFGEFFLLHQKTAGVTLLAIALLHFIFGPSAFIL
jgi:uncharacterized membrane protein HdeD (DUF308 family)